MTQIHLEIREVERERYLQIGKFGDQSGVPDDTAFRILGEEVGEVARALNDRESLDALYRELIQVATVTLVWAERVRRRRRVGR